MNHYYLLGRHISLASGLLLIMKSCLIKMKQKVTSHNDRPDSRARSTGRASILPVIINNHPLPPPTTHIRRFKERYGVGRSWSKPAPD